MQLLIDETGDGSQNLQLELLFFFVYAETIRITLNQLK
jgi:hypothetical protein